MKFFYNLIALSLLCTLNADLAFADGTYYLVRHAEKQKDGTKDPSLTGRGEQRAAYLAKQLSFADISKIYSTDYKRTRETAEPLANMLGLPIVIYNPRELADFAESLKAESGNFLIVGHSNTTPNLGSLLSGFEIDPIDETEYENLYQVVLIGESTRLNRLRIFPINTNKR